MGGSAAEAAVTADPQASRANIAIVRFMIVFLVLTKKVEDRHLDEDRKKNV
jgi:hypothetical protein